MARPAGVVVEALGSEHYRPSAIAANRWSIDGAGRAAAVLTNCAAAEGLTGADFTTAGLAATVFSGTGTGAPVTANCAAAAGLTGISAAASAASGFSGRTDGASLAATSGATGSSVAGTAVTAGASGVAAISVSGGAGDGRSGIVSIVPCSCFGAIAASDR